MVCDIEVQDAAAIVANDKEAVEQAERDRWDREEIHCRNRFSMIAQKCEPALGWFGISGCPAHPTGDGSLGNIKTQHEEFTMDARATLGSRQPSGR
jgi:hypothetical protein